MGYNHFRYARRVDANAIKIMNPSNFQMLRIKKESANAQRIYPTTSTQQYIELNDTGSLSMGTAFANLSLSTDCFYNSPSGYMRFGTHTAAGDAASNGYIIIKDAAGNFRNLMTR